MPRGGYGCKADVPDERDLKFNAARFDESFVLPDAHDLSSILPPAIWQGNAGICTTCGSTWAWRYNRLNSYLPDVPLSLAALYWDSGKLEGDTSDVGRQIRDVVKILATTGVAREELWGLDKIGQEPPPEVYADALNQTILEYERVDVTRQALNTALYVGRPVIIGIPVFAAFESDEVEEHGIVPMPGILDSPVGQHCMLLSGYDIQYDTVLNSWGLGWGLNGFCKLPRGYLEKYASDCWVIYMDKEISA